MQDEITAHVNEIMKRMTCQKGFQCAESGFSKLCRAQDIGLKRHLLCLDLSPSLCEYSIALEKKYFCACPLRVYLTKKLQNHPQKELQQVTR